MRCVFCTVRSGAPCGALNATALEKLDGLRLPPRRIMAGHSVFIHGDSSKFIYTVLSGWLALADTIADGETMILHFLLPGDLVPLEYQGQNSARTAFAVGDAIVCAVSLEHHAELQGRFPAYNSRFQATIRR